MNYSIKPVALIDVRDHGTLAAGGQYFKRKQVAPAESASEAVMMPAIAHWMVIETEAGILPSNGPPRVEALGAIRRTVSARTLRTDGRRITTSRLVCGVLMPSFERVRTMVPRDLRFRKAAQRMCANPTHS